jgi:hypothetical protein
LSLETPISNEVVSCIQVTRGLLQLLRSAVIQTAELRFSIFTLEAT